MSLVSTVDGQKTILMLSDDLEIRRCFLQFREGQWNKIGSTKVFSVFCNICKTMTETHSRMSKHKTVQHDTSKTLICDRCSLACFSSYNYRLHREKCLGFACPGEVESGVPCPFRARAKRAVLSHFRRVHRYDQLQ